MRFRGACLALILVACLATASLASAQSSIPSIQRVQAIQNAKIEIGDGRVIERGTIVMRDGMIVAVGPSVPIPKIADVFDATGLTVYPGFIDGYTTKGLKLPEAKPKQDDQPPVADYASAFMPSMNRSKIRAEVGAASNLALDDQFLKGYWEAGFTSALLAPETSIVGGTAALVDFGKEPPREAVVNPTVGMTMGFGGNSGEQGYPATVLGSIALLRQTLLDVTWQQQVGAAYDAGGSVRPAFDPALTALRPVVSHTMPALFEANGQYEIVRSIDIAQEFGFKPIIVGGGAAWKEIDRLKRRQTPVLVSLAFGDEPKSNPPKDEADEPENPLKLAERTRIYMEVVHNAVRLDEAGVPFAFTTKGVKGIDEFQKNLRRLVKEGLPRAKALAALTVQPARIFGLERRLGSIEEGKIANLTVMSGDFLDEKTKVKMLYIDGRKIDLARLDVGSSPRQSFGEDGN